MSWKVGSMNIDGQLTPALLLAAIPATIGNLASLVKLGLGSNKLHGLCSYSAVLLLDVYMSICAS